MFQFRKILEEIQKEAEPRGKSIWVSPDGERINTRPDSHLYYIVRNPEEFGLENVTEENVREKVKRLYKDGWIRATIDRGQEVSIQGTESAIEDKMYMFYNRAPHFYIDIVDPATGEIERSKSLGAFDFGQKNFLTELRRRDDKESGVV